MVETSQSITVRILSPQGIVVEQEAYAVKVQSTEGSMTLLPNHAPVFAGLEIGAIRIQTLAEAQDDVFVAVDGGVLEMENNLVEIVSTYAIEAGQLDEAELKLQEQQAEAEMKSAQAVEDRRKFRRAEFELQRAINMLRVARHQI